MGELSGKVAIVTGASKGIGAAIARRFAEAGAAVAVNYASDKTGADRVVEQIKRGGGKAVAIQANELCGKVGDGVNQAADLISATASIPSLNCIPLTTFGNWF